jgi:hypothetical protein
MSRIVLIIIPLLLAPLRGVLAQDESEGDARAALALSLTPIGALTPPMSAAMVGRQLRGGQFGVRYGFREDREFQALAATGVFALGLRSTVSITAGATDADCIGCEIALSAGLGADYRLLGVGEPAGRGTAFSISISGDAGYARVKPGDADAFAFGVGAPITFSYALGGKESMHVVPYFTPVFGMGSTNGPCVLVLDCDKSGTRWVLGGGIGIWNPLSIVSISIGVNKVMWSDSDPLYGINAVFGGR